MLYSTRTMRDNHATIHNPLQSHTLQEVVRLKALLGR